MAKTLIAYFSHAGENYFGGHIRSISKGNTAVAAEFVQKATGGTLFEIRTVKTIPSTTKRVRILPRKKGGQIPAPNCAVRFPISAPMIRLCWAIPAGGEQCCKRCSRFWKVRTLPEKRFCRFARTKEAENRARHSRFNRRIPKRSSSKHLQCADKRHKKWRMPQSATRSNGSERLR